MEMVAGSDGPKQPSLEEKVKGYYDKKKVKVKGDNDKVKRMKEREENEDGCWVAQTTFIGGESERIL